MFILYFLNKLFKKAICPIIFNYNAVCLGVLTGFYKHY